jgi:ferritin-like metal-binding protein YciE
MGIFTKDIQSMDDLFVHTLRDIYYAEKQIVKALPSMIEKATDENLKQGFTDHLEETRTHVTRLEEVFQLLDTTAKTVSCPAIDGILKEASEIASDVADKEVLDAALIMAAQAVEHYEITRYGTLIAWARQLGRDDCAALLEETLEEEKTADEQLTMLAERGINAEAAEAA